MADGPGSGARIARWRRRRGISQAALAGLVGRSESWLSQVERGTRGVDSISVLRELARVLRVDLDDLSPPSLVRSREYDEPVTARIEQAVLDPGPAEPSSSAQVAAVHAAYQDARYTDVLTELPELVESLTTTGDLTVLIAGWTVVAKTLTKIGALDLALLTADRARDCARRAGDQADLGMATYQVVCALLPGAQASLAEELAVTFAESSHGEDDAVRSVVGALWLIAAVAAARRGDRDAAAARLDRARMLAETLGRDDNLRWTAFGPTNVRLHRVSVAAELGDAPAALAAADSLDTNSFDSVPRSRRAQVGLDVAWAHACRRQDADAVLALLDVERHAPDVVRHNVYARTTVTTLLGRARGAAGGHARALAARGGIAL